MRFFAGSNPDGYGGRTQVGYDNMGEYTDELVFLDGVFQGGLAGDATAFALDEVPAGEHCVVLGGQLTTAEGIATMESASTEKVFRIDVEVVAG